MITRMLVVIGLIGLVFAIRWYIWWRSQHAANNAHTVGLIPTGHAGIVALHTDNCMQCERLQKPALQRVQQQRADVKVVWRSVHEETQLVKELGILTVPSTVVHDTHGRIVKINMGYTDDKILLQQLALVSAPPHCT